ncbi:SRPBCC family protein [Neobacillus sp. SCS-31]|uniref:SRPBCC family protein n=1 Tax=Neobacillus oceani TaxID=3115292 RepID=UPI00390686DF
MEGNMSNDTGIQDLIISRVLDASLEEAWKAWSDSEYVMQWWGPDCFTSPFAKIDFREGGKSLVCMSSPQFGDHYNTWEYTKIEPLKEIEYINNLTDHHGNKIDPLLAGFPADFPQDQLHTVTFKLIGDNKTEMTVTEHRWPAGKMMELSKKGMGECLDKLASIYNKSN